MRFVPAIGAVLALAGLIAVALGSVQVQAKPLVVATFSVLGDVARVVGGDRVVLATLVGADGDTERYEPTPGDAQALASAALVLENGLGSEPWLDRLYSVSRSSARRIQTSTGLDLLRDEDSGELDPHVWHDPSQMIQVVQNVRDALVQQDPPNAGVYTANADAYMGQLRELDTWVRGQVESLPPDRRKLVTSHDTFGYFARRYGLDVVGEGLESFFTEAQPSAAQIGRLVQNIRAQQVRVVFVENVTDPRLMQTIAREAGVVVGPSLYTDALGGPGTPGETYLGMVRYNVASIVGALAS